MGVAEYVRIAMRYDTLMSCAMLKACGVTREEAQAAFVSSPERYGGIIECFENRARVRMDYGA